jgi:hypothetical protein
MSRPGGPRMRVLKTRRSVTKPNGLPKNAICAISPANRQAGMLRVYNSLPDCGMRNMNCGIFNHHPFACSSGHASGKA